MLGRILRRVNYRLPLRHFCSKGPSNGNEIKPIIVPQLKNRTEITDEKLEENTENVKIQIDQIPEEAVEALKEKLELNEEEDKESEETEQNRNMRYVVGATTMFLSTIGLGYILTKDYESEPDLVSKDDTKALEKVNLEINDDIEEVNEGIKEEEPVEEKREEEPVKVEEPV